MRVLFVVNDLEVGGSERQALLLAKDLAREMHVEMWALERDGVLADLCRDAGISSRVVGLSWPDTVSDVDESRRHFAAMVAAARIDILLPYTIFPNVISGLAWQETGARGCIWNQRDAGVMRMLPSAERTAVERTPRFVSNSTHAVRFLTGALGAPVASVHVIRNGVPPLAPIDRAEARSRLGLRSDDLVACMIASISRFKDHASLIDAWHLALPGMSRQGKSPVLMLAGRCDQNGAQLIEQISARGLGDSVRWIGYASDVSTVIAASDIGVFASTSEGLPNGVLECMAGGLVVVATDIPGVREAVGPDGTALLAPVHDAAALADRLIVAVHDDGWRAALGAANRQRVASEFGVDRLCAQMRQVITEVLHG